MYNLLQYIILDRKYNQNVQCHYCQTSAVLIDSAFVYKKSFGLIWYCDGCGAYVGVHKKTHSPLGTLADKPLRKARMRVHSKFDPIWRKGKMKRKHAYEMLARIMDMPSKKCHIGYFDLETCTKAMAAIKQIGSQ